MMWFVLPAQVNKLQFYLCGLNHNNSHLMSTPVKLRELYRGLEVTYTVIDMTYVSRKIYMPNRKRSPDLSSTENIW